MPKLHKRRALAVLLAAVLCVSLSFPALADEPIVYTSNTGHTPEEIGQAYAAALEAGESCVDNDAASYYSTPCSLESPYAPGVLTEDTQTAMLAMTNYYRWLVGVDPLSSVPSFGDSLQKGAFVRCFSFKYAPDPSARPDDMDQTLWDEGAAAQYNLLARRATPRGVIPVWLNEGYTLYDGQWNTVGHRMSLLGSAVSGILFGYSGDVAIARIVENGSMTQPFAAYPAAGCMPLNAINAQSTAWSVELNPDVLRCDGSAVATITNLTTGETETRTVSDNTLRAGGTISFVQPTPADGSAYGASDSYRVQISGLTDVATGGPAAIDYSVTFIDVREHAPTTVTACTPAPWEKLHISRAASNSPEALLQIAAILPREVTVSTDVGRTFTLSASGAWQPDPENMRWVNSVDASGLPAEVTDPNGLLAEVSIPWDVKTGGTIRGTNLNGAAGESGTISVRRTSTGYKQIDLYQLTSDDSGWSARKRLSELATESTTVFRIDPLLPSDNGKWFAVYYSADGAFKDAYVLGDLTVDVQSAEGSVEFLAPNYPWDDVLTLTASSVGTTVLRQPDYPSYFGYTFTGVTVACGGQSETITASVVETEALNEAIARVAEAAGESSVTVTANYEKNVETYSVQVANALSDGTDLGGGYTGDGYVVGSAVQLTAAQTRTYHGETVWFDHWDVGGAEYAATVITLRPNAEGTYTATAVYKPEQPAAQTATVSILSAEAETLNGVNKTAVTMTWSLPEGCTLVKAGFEVSVKADLSKISTAASKLTTATGAYTLHVKMQGKEDTPLYARAFLTYTDADGEHTIYTDPWQEYVWNVLNRTL